MKYKIEVNGRGCEAFLFKLNEEQYSKLYDSDVESGSMSYDEICEILGVESYWDGNDSLTGIYNGSNHGEYCWITVTDENGEVVWESDESFNFEEIEDSYEFNDGRILLIEDYQKGNFFNYDLELDSDFDHNLLSAKIVELLDGRSEIITDIKYDGSSIDIKDYGDTTSKGYTYMLL